MVLEACMICIDSSAFARNGDLPPTRVVAQLDAITLICNTKLNSNRENAVGVLTLGNERVNVRVSPTGDVGCVLSALHGIECDGEADFLRGVHVAQLALKHRMNKNLKQRIVLFVASPMAVTEKSLTQLGKQLKKNNVSVDIVCLSDFDVNMPKLNAFFNVVNSNNTSHLIEYPVGSGQLLSDVIVSARILYDHDAGSGTTGADPALFGDTNTASAINEFGVDPAADPELYLALRLSLEEERARSQQQQPPQQTSTETEQPQAPASGGVEAIAMMEDIDDELRQALLLSLQDYSGGNENAESMDVDQSNNDSEQTQNDSNANPES